MSKFYLFAYARYDTHNGGMGDYKDDFDSIEAAEKVILDLEDCDWAEIATITDAGKLIEVASYQHTNEWLNADHHLVNYGPMDSPSRWVNNETGANVTDGKFMVTSWTPEDMENAMGSYSNPVLYEDEQFFVQHLIRIGFVDSNGISWSPDTGMHYKKVERHE